MNIQEDRTIEDIEFDVIIHRHELTVYEEGTWRFELAKVNLQISLIKLHLLQNISLN